MNKQIVVSGNTEYGYNGKLVIGYDRKKGEFSFRFLIFTNIGDEDVVLYIGKEGAKKIAEMILEVVE